MKAEEIRSSLRWNVDRIAKRDFSNSGFDPLIFSALMEIAAQLAELNEGLRKGDFAVETKVVEP